MNINETLEKQLLELYGPVLTAKEVGEILKVRENTIRRWTMANKIPYNRRNGITRYILSDIIQWLTAKQQTT